MMKVNDFKLGNSFFVFIFQIASKRTEPCAISKFGTSSAEANTEHFCIRAQTGPRQYRPQGQGQYDKVLEYIVYGRFYGFKDKV